ncbi:hypothetical protein [Collimonas sp. OK607]|uniref:hypothetical protein n=1 Tax=Collimonas sp. OK607 TaxID=1798194 RepID=UPI00147E46F7|nr:hypothetical protein [Collimonas sp. OK607]
MHACLNSLMAFAILGIAETIQPVFKRFQIRYHGALSAFVALVIVISLVVGLLLEAFRE